MQEYLCIYVWACDKLQAWCCNMHPANKQWLSMPCTETVEAESAPGCSPLIVFTTTDETEAATAGNKAGAGNAVGQAAGTDATGAFVASSARQAAVPLHANA